MQATRSYDANKSESFIYFLRHSMRDLWTYRFAFANLVRNAVVQRYRRSLLGVRPIRRDFRGRAAPLIITKPRLRATMEPRPRL